MQTEVYKHMGESLGDPDTHSYFGKVNFEFKYLSKIDCAIIFSQLDNRTSNVTLLSNLNQLVLHTENCNKQLVKLQAKYFFPGITLPKDIH